MAKRFVSVYFPNMAIDWFELRKPELKKKPFVLTATSHNRIIVVAANSLAQKSGVYPQMVLADAKALVASLSTFDDKPTLVPQLLQRCAEWAIRFTPIAAPQPPDGIILDATGCTHLWGSEEDYLKDILQRLKAKGYTAHTAMADTIGAAWAGARFRGTRIIGTGQHKEALLSLPPEALRLQQDTAERLYKLGLLQVKDFINIPRPSLRRRFGQNILLRLDQALGTSEEFITPVYPVEPYQERLPSIEPIVTRKGIEIALERLLFTLCNRLKSEGKGLRSAYFRCYRLDGTAQGIEITTNKPSHHLTHLFHLFSLNLSIIEPKEGIELFILEPTKVETAIVLQQAFWKESGGLNDLHLSELIDRISAKLGANVIQRFLPAEHHIPERSIKKAASLEEEKTTEWNDDKPRPIQLMTPPEKIEVTAPVPDYPPMNFRYKGKLHIIKKADGPERIEQEWWIADGRHRDYYAVEDEEGHRYWLFRSGHYNAEKTYGWYLHGFFA